MKTILLAVLTLGLFACAQPSEQEEARKPVPIAGTYHAPDSTPITITDEQVTVGALKYNITAVVAPENLMVTNPFPAVDNGPVFFVWQDVSSQLYLCQVKNQIDAKADLTTGCDGAAWTLLGP